MTSYTGVPPNSPNKYLGPNVAINSIVTRTREPTTADYRQPETGKLYPLGSFWLVGKDPTTGAQGDFWFLSSIIANVANWSQISGTGVGQTITGDINTDGSPGSPVSPTAGNWFILGQQDGLIPVMDTIDDVAASTLRIEDRTHTTKFVVDPSIAIGVRGTFSTIQTAIDAASSGSTIFIKDGTYLENLTLKAGVNLASYNSAFTPGVKIKGKCTMTTAGVVTISGIALETNTDYAISVTGSSASQLYINNCTVSTTDFTAIQLTSSSSSSFVRLEYSWIFTSTSGFGFFTISGAGSMYLSNVTNPQGANTAVQSTFSSDGTLRIEGTYITFPITTSGNGRISITHSTLSTVFGTDRTCITVGGIFATTGIANYIRHSNLFSGTTTALVMSAGLDFYNNNVSSNNANPISGTGALNCSGNTYVYQTFIPSTTGITVQRSFTEGGRYVGDWSGVAVTAGSIGEQLNSKVEFNAGISLTNNAVTNVTSIVLTPGFWSVSGIVMFKGITTGTYQDSSIGDTSATISASSFGENTISTTFTSTSAADVGSSIPNFIMKVTPADVTKTAFLIARAGFTVGTVTAYGTIRAIRIA